MAGITGLSTTYNTPNYTGELFAIAPSDTPFLTAIGGLSGGGSVESTEIEWETYDYADPAQTVQLEGAVAPNAAQRVRANVTNVVEIHQSKVSVSYSKLAAFGLKNGTNNGDQNPVKNESDFQIDKALKGMALDIEWSLLNGIYQKPGNNSTARQTRGLLTAITTNRIAAPGAVGATTANTNASSATDTITTAAVHGFSVGSKLVFSAVGTATGIRTQRIYYVTNVGSTTTFKVASQPGGTAITLGTSTANISYVNPSPTTTTKAVINNLAQTVYDTGGISDLNAATFLVPSTQKLAISNAYASSFQENSRIIGGINVSTVVTDFGTVNVMTSRRIPQDQIVLASLEVCMPVFLNVPDRGHLFVEPLAKVGASDDVQIYGEVGLAYGPETAHGILTGLQF
jgi:Family of unknown function (DUF5309)